MSFENHCVVVTGAGRGLGRGCALAFAAKGAEVILVARSGDELAQVEAEIRSAGGSAQAVSCDLTQEAEIQRLFGSLRRCDVLVNSAGFTRMVPHHDLEALDDDLIDQVLTANVRGPFATIRAFVPLLRESGDGVIVNISSGAAQSGTGSSMIYAASKAALNTMSLSLARVLGPEIRVIVVAPGMVHTGFVPGRTEEMMAKAAMATPLKRAIEPEDVALAVISCVTHLTHTTGSIIAVDAGRHL